MEVFYICGSYRPCLHCRTPIEWSSGRCARAATGRPGNESRQVRPKYSLSTSPSLSRGTRSPLKSASTKPVMRGSEEPRNSRRTSEFQQENWHTTGYVSGRLLVAKHPRSGARMKLWRSNNEGHSEEAQYYGKAIRPRSDLPAKAFVGVLAEVARRICSFTLVRECGKQVVRAMS